MVPPPLAFLLQMAPLTFAFAFVQLVLRVINVPLIRTMIIPMMENIVGQPI
jgi:hypothetical protein